MTLTITDAKPYYLIADSTDGSPLQVRRTRAGAAWDRAQADSCAVPTHQPSPSTPGRVSLGLPTLRVATSPIYDLADGER